MEVSYKRRFNQSYMILKGTETPEEIYELTMLAYNQIPGFLNVETEVADGEVCFWYDITGKQSLMDYLERKLVDIRLLELLFQAVEQMCQETEAYLLEEEHILLDAEYLYIDFTYHKAGFVYLPGEKRDIRDSFRELMELLLKRLDHSDKQGAAMAYEMYQLSLKKELSLFDMIRQAGKAGYGKESRSSGNDSREKEFREREDGDTKEQKTEEAVKNPPIQPQKTAGFHDSPKKNSIGFITKMKAGWKDKNWESRRAEKEELPYVTEEEEETSYPTEILSIQSGKQGLLQYQGNGGQQDIRIDKPTFLIGKSAKEADGCINSGSVSRVHARITQEDEEYYLEDMNSTNGTLLNGELLEYRQKVKLESRDRIAFGSEEYIFGSELLREMCYALVKDRRALGEPEEEDENKTI